MSKTYKSEFLNTMEERGFINQCSNFDELDKKLCEGVQSAYIGFDATAQSLHIGNLTGIMMLHWFQKCGHKPITLMGGGTSKIGDPSFKDEQRKLLDDAAIEENMEAIRRTCFTQFLTYGDGETDALMVNNNDWLDGLKYLEFLRDYGKHFTVNRMLSFESVKQRLERESPLSLLEFNYMVMQGYDFVELHRRYGTVLQMGGSDQWGNIINGVELGHKAHRYDLFALTAPLLTTPDGKKMGKTESGAVWLNAEILPPYDYYQYWRNVDDVMVGTLLRRFTLLPIDEIEKLEALEGQEINEAKKVLAFEATKLCHGANAAQEAAKTAKNVFERGSVGSELPSFFVTHARLEEGVSILDLICETELAKSKGEARKLIQQGGIRIDDQQVTNEKHIVTANDMALDYDREQDGNWIKLSAGKKKHVLVRVK
ncbi:MAG: tyrosine--tRNA ligase [Rhodospirillales bacterium]|nr:tyrosine--tRNA ligase [Rhodospirillales bacterium]